MSTHVARVGAENAAWLAANVGPADGNPPVYADLGDGRVEILDLAAAMAVGPDYDGGVVRDAARGLVLYIEGDSYAVEQS